MWKGAGLGALLFFGIAVVGALTPLRVPLLKVVGRDYAALQLQQQAAEAVVPPSPRVSPVPARERADVRLDAWHKRNETLSVFGLLGWFMDMWPWLLGLGVALPVLGGLIGASGAGGAQTRPQPRAVPASRRASTSAAAPAPPHPAPPSGEPSLVESPSASPSPRAPAEPAPPFHPVSDAAESAAETPVVPAAPAAPATPLPPSEWSWNARPAPRTTPGRPKPPPVQSPNSDPL